MHDLKFGSSVRNRVYLIDINHPYSGLQNESKELPDFLEFDNPSMRLLFQLCWSGDSDGLRTLLLSDEGSTIDLHQKDAKGNTCVHIAATHGSFNCLEILLKSNLSMDVNERNDEGRSPLHCAILNCEGANISSRQCTQLLINSEGVDLNLQDNDGKTALHFAAEKERSICSGTLLRNGVHLGIKSNHPIDSQQTKVGTFEKIRSKTISYLFSLEDKPTKSNKVGVGINEKCLNSNSIRKSRYALPSLLQQMPFLIDNVKACLNQSVSLQINSQNHHIQGNRVRFDFKTILPYSLTKPTKGTCPGKETELLAELLSSTNKSVRKEIFVHPLVRTFMYLKWHRMSWVFKFYTWLYGILALLFTFYVLTVFVVNCPYQGDSLIPIQSSNTKEQSSSPTVRFTWLGVSNNNDNNNNNAEELNKIIAVCDRTSGWPIFIVSIIILVLTTCITLDKLFKLIKQMHFMSYLTTWRHYVNWIAIICIYCSVCPVVLIKGTQLFYWQYTTSAVGLLALWTAFLLQLGRFPQFALYLEMFGTVLKNFIFFMITYSSLIIAFVAAFSVVFPGHPSFASLPRSILKILVMMSGEIEYDDLFYGTKDNGIGNDYLVHPVIAHLFYAAFVIIITVVLMNLLLGLAVDDIKGLRKEAELSRITRHIQEISNLENLIFSENHKSCCSSTIEKFFKKRFCIATQLQDGCYYICTNSAMDENATLQDLMMSSIRLANQNRIEIIRDDEAENVLGLGLGASNASRRQRSMRQEVCRSTCF